MYCIELDNESQIDSYLKDMGSEFFDCGQGYYEDTAEVYVKVKEYQYQKFHIHQLINKK